MSAWWYAQNGKKLGPVDEGELRRLYLSANIDGSTMLWREGMEAWQPLTAIAELEALKATVPPPLPPKPAPNPLTLPMARRWPRFFARMLDVWWESLLLAIAVGAVLGRYSAGYVEWISQPGSTQVFGLLIIPLSMVVDAGIYAVAGNTPGKALFGLRVTAFHGEHLRFVQYLQRNLQVWVSGLALGFPVANLFTLLYQSRRIAKGLPASYDEGKGFAVRAWPTGFLRKLGSAVAFIGLFAVMVWLNAVDDESQRNTVAASQPPYSWQNPQTGVSARIEARWKNAITKNEQGEEIYTFTEANDRAVVVLGVERLPSGHSIREYIDAFREGTKAQMHFDDGGQYLVEGHGHPMWMASGTMSQSQSNRLTVHVIQLGNSYWRVVTVQALPYDYSDGMVKNLEASLWGTVGLAPLQ